MIISHKYKFIFIKTAKTAGTSIEVFLSSLCDEKDVLTPIFPPEEHHVPRNYKGFFNPMNEILSRVNTVRKATKAFLTGKKFYNHMYANLVKSRINPSVWKTYYKFCVERNPWDKTLSHYSMINSRTGGLSLDEYFKGGDFCLNYPFYTDKKGIVIVDDILRYEDLNNELGRVFNKLHVPYSGALEVKVKGEFRKERKAPVEVFSNSQLDILNKVFEKEIKLMNYSL